MASLSALPRHWLLQALELETDRAHGASHLSREAVRAFRAAVEEAWTESAEPEAVRAQLRHYAERLRAAQPSMAPVASRLARCVAALEGGREAALAEADAVLRAAEAAEEALTAHAEPLIRPGIRVITLSHSEAVARILTRYADRLENVTVCESRPLNEGIALAAALGELALPVRLITEAQLELFLPECDLALVGADRVLPDNSVVNKAGTAVLARCCAAHGIPFYVAADRSRWVGERDDLARFTRENRAPSEVLPNPPQGVRVANVAFDLTPASLVTGYLCETGVLNGPPAAARTVEPT